MWRSNKGGSSLHRAVVKMVNTSAFMSLVSFSLYLCECLVVVLLLFTSTAAAWTERT